MSATPGSEPYVHYSPLPWWNNRFSGTSGGVKLSLVTDQRSEKPSFWEPRPVDAPSSAVTAPASSSLALSPSPFPPPGIAPPTSPPANTRSLESVRMALARKDQHYHTQHVASTDADGDSASNSNSEKSVKPHSARQWRNRDTQSTPGTPTGTHDYPYSQPYAHFRGQGRGRGRGRGTWSRGREPADAEHLDARAQEFVPGQQSATIGAREAEGFDLNEYIRAGTGTETTIGSSRVSVFGSGSRSPASSSVEEEREARSTERERQEAERQWHLQTSWDDDDGHAPRDDWSGSAPGFAKEPGEAGQEDGGEVRGEWEAGVVSETLDVSGPTPLEPLIPTPTTVKLPAPTSVPLEPPVRPPSEPKEAQPASQTLPFGLVLERAQMLQEGTRVAYPKEIKPPGVHAYASAKVHRLCYNRDFLLQFQHICTGRPIAVPHIPPFWHAILAPYHSRPTPVRTREKWVQTSLDDAAHDSLPQDQRQRRTVDIGIETNQPSNEGDTTRLVDVVYNRLVPAPDDRDRPRSIGLGSRQSSLLSSELTCRATPSGDENVFEYEVQEAHRERLEARVEYLATEVRVLRLELARIRKIVG